MVVDSEVYVPNPVVEELRRRAVDLLDPCQEESWLVWAGRHELMPKTMGVYERRLEMQRRQEAVREKERLAMAERARQAALALATRANTRPVRSSARVGPSTAAMVDDDVEMRSETGSEVKRARAKAKGKGKAKAKAEEEDEERVMPADAVKVSRDLMSHIFFY